MGLSNIAKCFSLTWQFSTVILLNKGGVSLKYHWYHSLQLVRTNLRVVACFFWSRKGKKYLLTHFVDFISWHQKKLWEFTCRNMHLELKLCIDQPNVKRFGSCRYFMFKFLLIFFKLLNPYYCFLKRHVHNIILYPSLDLERD